MVNKFQFVSFILIFFQSKLIDCNPKSVDFNFKISEIHDLIINHSWNCSDIIRYFIDRSISYNSILKAIINYNPKAFEEAKMLDEYYFGNNRKFYGKLHCIPILVKDNIDVKSIPTTGGIKAFRNLIPRKDAIVVERLRKEGGIIIAKSNLAELAAGITNNELGGECVNPWDIRRSSGPSSTGIGAGISSGLAVLGIATDTSGSIMNPSSFCGIFGLRPSFSAVEFEGINSYFVKSDTVGPITKYIDDLVLAYSIMINKTDIYDKYQLGDSSQIKIGSVKPFWSNFNISYPSLGDFTYKFDEQVYEALNNTKNNFIRSNYKIIDIEVNQTEFDELNQLSYKIILSGLYNCIDSCFKASFEKYINDSDRFQSDSPYKTYTDILSSPLLNHWFERFNRSNFQNPNEICKSGCEIHDSLRLKFTSYVNDWFIRANVDLLILPTSLDLPFFINQTEPLINASPTFISPYTGLPSLNIPIGFSKSDKYAPDGVPIGLMMITKSEDILSAFKLAKVYEKYYLTNIINKLPKITPKIDYSCNGSPDFNSVALVLLSALSLSLF